MNCLKAAGQAACLGNSCMRITRQKHNLQMKKQPVVDVRGCSSSPSPASFSSPFIFKSTENVVQGQIVLKQEAVQWRRLEFGIQWQILLKQN